MALVEVKIRGTALVLNALVIATPGIITVSYSYTVDGSRTGEFTVRNSSYRDFFAPFIPNGEQCKSDYREIQG
jgi:hypothetical protein